MSLQCGIVGLPNVGKSTLFNALTAAGAAAANYPFCTIDPNIGVVPLPEPRLETLSRMFQPDKTTPTAIEFVDIAGLVAGASKGAGLGNQFLGHIRNVDAIVHVVRCFEDPDVVHVSGSIDPLRDLEVIHTELALADLETVEKRLGKTSKAAKSGDKKSIAELPLLERLKTTLNEGKPARSLSLSDEEKPMLRDLFLLTAKPLLYVANVSEKEWTGLSSSVKKLTEAARREGTVAIPICGKVEAEIAELKGEERTTFLKEMGLSESGLDRLAREGYKLLNLITFFTAGKQEVRAWTVTRGTKAPQAAGVIHSDFEKGFIKAETYHYDDLIANGSELKVKEKGLLRLEGKDYTVQDGDIFYFRFNV
ncbi:MAG: redox-regulated ATPase YchF [Deltaproteobacteria bacterium]|nr:redox-regulated ATPase YchF [Deltaproteobacteria bacterium]